MAIPTRPEDLEAATRAWLAKGKKERPNCRYLVLGYPDGQGIVIGSTIVCAPSDVEALVTCALLGDRGLPVFTLEEYAIELKVVNDLCGGDETLFDFWEHVLPYHYYGEDLGGYLRGGDYAHNLDYYTGPKAPKAIEYPS